MKKVLALTLLLFGMTTLSCGSSDAESSTNPPAGNDSKNDTTSTTTEEKMLGADLSMLPEYEKVGVTYRDSSGNTIVPLTYFKQQGMNAVRARLFVNPTNESGVVQDEAYVIALAKRVKAAGMKFMLDLHYSDTWADPERQTTPKAWEGLSTVQLETKLYDYTKLTLQNFVKAGVTPDMIQTGNEVSYGLFYTKGNNMLSYSNTKNWEQFARYMKSAGKACREVCPKAKIILHIERTASPTECSTFYNYMNTYEVDYDVIGLSYYPVWHGTLNMLDATLTTLENRFKREIMICEFGYNYAWYPTDASYSATTIGYPGTREGQRAITANLVSLLKRHSYVKGLFWWFAEENESLGTGGSTGLLTGWMNRGLFQNHISDSWQTDGRALPALYELKKFL